MRERPFEVLSDVHSLSWGSLTTAGGYAMPSGHTARAFAMTALIALWTRSRGGVALLVVATLIGLSRIYLGLHWPSDVLVGALVGILFALIMYRVGKGTNSYTRRRNHAIAWLRGQK
jgi:undecaprenyl-diphosphatase